MHASARATPAQAPTTKILRDAALQHLARYTATRAGLTRMLERRITSWAKLADPTAEELSALRTAVHDVVAGLVAEGVLNDAAFAETRAKRLMRAGRSRRAVAAHLAARGVDSDLQQIAIQPVDELAAALATARRRHIGPFRKAPADADGSRRELAMLARAGFARDVATAALRMALPEAEAIVLQLKRG